MCFYSHRTAASYVVSHGKAYQAVHLHAIFYKFRRNSANTALTMYDSWIYGVSVGATDCWSRLSRPCDRQNVDEHKSKMLRPIFNNQIVGIAGHFVKVTWEIHLHTILCERFIGIVSFPPTSTQRSGVEKLRQ